MLTQLVTRKSSAATASVILGLFLVDGRWRLRVSMTDVQIKVNGVGYLDFTSVAVDLSMEQFARTFRATFSDKFFQSSLFPFPFDEGAEVKVTWDGEEILDGFIDEIPVSYSAQTHTVGITGRSWTGHLVDCSAIHKTGAWRDSTLLQIAKDICEPFGITVKFDPLTVPPSDAAQLEKFRKFAIEDEETAYDCLNRAAKLRSVFLLSNAKRELIFAKSGAPPTPSGATLKYGVNILSGTRIGRFQQRYRDYIVKSQNAGADDFFGDAARGVFRTNDPQVAPYRPLIIVSDGQGRASELELRANWERNVRAGRSRRVSYQVQGAHSLPLNSGPLWQPNTSVVVDDPLLDIRDNLLLVSATLQYSAQGTISSLELARPEAFAPEIPPKPRAKKSGGWAGW